MINTGYNIPTSVMNSASNIALNSIKETQLKIDETAKKVATGDVNVVEQLMQNKNYTQQVQAASKVIETENETIGVLINTFA